MKQKYKSSLLKYGTEVEARLLEKDFHAVFQFEEGTIFVNAMEMYGRYHNGWHIPLEEQKIGDIMKVLITGYNYRNINNNVYFGSLRNTTLKNPYLDLTQFSPNTVFRGNFIPGGYVCLPNQAIGRLSPYCKSDIRSNGSVEVIISRLMPGETFDAVLFETPNHNTRKKFIPEKTIMDLSEYALDSVINGRFHQSGMLKYDVYSAQYDSVSEQGILLNYEGDQIFVDSEHLSWRFNPDVSVYRAGEAISVRLIGYDYNKNHWLGSLKSVLPDNPFFELGCYPPQTILEGTVQDRSFASDPRIYGYGCFRIDLPNGAWGWLRSDGETSSIQFGEKFSVTVDLLTLSPESAHLLLKSACRKS